MKWLWNAKRVGVLSSRGFPIVSGQYVINELSTFRMFGFAFGRLFVGVSIKEPTQ